MTFNCITSAKKKTENKLNPRYGDVIGSKLSAQTPLHSFDKLHRTLRSTVVVRPLYSRTRRILQTILVHALGGGIACILWRDRRRTHTWASS